MPADLPAARAAAEEFRAMYLTGKPYYRFPLDTVFIADNVLRLDVIDFPGLVNLTGSSAYVTSSLKELYLDEAMVSASESKWRGPSIKNRLRFSVAHEIGHIVMHAHLVAQVRCQQIADLPALINNQNPVKETVEKEANEFAGRLIAPESELRPLLDNFGKLTANPKWRDDGSLRTKFADLCCKKFGLHADGIKTRLDREGLWPSDWIVGGG
jgi:hypothetical protein